MEATFALRPIDIVRPERPSKAEYALWYCREDVHHLWFDRGGFRERITTLLDSLSDSGTSGDHHSLLTRFDDMVQSISDTATWALTDPTVQVSRVFNRSDYFDQAIQQFEPSSIDERTRKDIQSTLTEFSSNLIYTNSTPAVVTAYCDELDGPSSFDAVTEGPAPGGHSPEVEQDGGKAAAPNRREERAHGDPVGQLTSVLQNCGRCLIGIAESGTWMLDHLSPEVKYRASIQESLNQLEIQRKIISEIRPKQRGLAPSTEDRTREVFSEGRTVLRSLKELSRIAVLLRNACDPAYFHLSEDSQRSYVKDYADAMRMAGRNLLNEQQEIEKCLKAIAARRRQGGGPTTQ